MVLNRFHISRLRLHFGMILQGRDIQPEPSEKVRSPENNFEYVLNMCRTVYSSSQKTRHELIRGGLCFTRQASILHAECLCQKGFQSSERLFQNLDEQNKGLTLRTSAIIYFRGNMSNKKDSMLTISLTEKASMWGASCETRKGFALRTAVTKGIHLGGMLL